MLKKDKFAKMCKEKMVDELSTLFTKHPNFILTSYMGTSVADLESIRKNLRPLASRYIVVKNSILNVVLNKQKLENMKSLVDSGMGVSFSGQDIVATAKILVNFSKANDKFKIKGAIVDGKIMTIEEVKALASLPSREVLLGMVVGGIKSPITGFVNTLGGILRKFVYAVDAIKTKKQSRAENAPNTASA
jgi:large subunit ribosomal protein L10